jgi:hypothetical protein
MDFTKDNLNMTEEIFVVRDEVEEQKEEHGLQYFIEEIQYWLDIIHDEKNEVQRIYSCCDLYQHLDKKIERFREEPELQSLFMIILEKTVEKISELSILAISNDQGKEIHNAIAYTMPYLSSVLLKLTRIRYR